MKIGIFSKNTSQNSIQQCISPSISCLTWLKIQRWIIPVTPSPHLAENSAVNNYCDPSLALLKIQRWIISVTPSVAWLKIQRWIISVTHLLAWLTIQRWIIADLWRSNIFSRAFPNGHGNYKLKISNSQVGSEHAKCYTPNINLNVSPFMWIMDVDCLSCFIWNHWIIFLVEMGLYLSDWMKACKSKRQPKHVRMHTT